VTAALTRLGAPVVVGGPHRTDHRPRRPRPQVLLLVLVALVPFNGLLLIVPHPGFVEAWKETLVVAAVALAILTPSPVASRRRVPAWAVASALLAGWGAFSLAASRTAASLIGFKIGFFYLLVPLVLWHHPFDRRDRRRYVTVLQVTGVITAVVGLAQQVVGPAYLARLGFPYNSTIRTAGGTLRAFSTFDQPFPFALFVVMVLVIGVPAALERPRRRGDIAFLAASPLLVAAATTAIVRAALVGLAAGGVYLAVRRYHQLAHVAVPALVAVVVVLSLGLSGPLLSATSLGERTAGWSDVTGPFVTSPLGLGLGTTGAAAEKVAGEVATGGGSPVALGPDGGGYQPDNAYVQLALQLGVPGLWLFCLVLAGAWAAGRTTERVSTGRDRGLATGITASVVAAVAAGAFSTYWEIFPMDLFFWLNLGVLASIAATPAPSPAPG
jgi:putative inorganic carbon (hco3(-)) transporter